jgi:hypothetical protein
MWLRRSLESADWKRRSSNGLDLDLGFDFDLIIWVWSASLLAGRDVGLCVIWKPLVLITQPGISSETLGKPTRLCKSI